MLKSFDVAYAPYDATNFDGLEVLVSTDCGVTFTSVYLKSNTTLATAPATTGSFVPTAAQWRTETINLNSYIGQNAVTVAIRNIAGYGNNLYVDNINISGVAAPLAPVASFTSTPTSTVCIGQTVQYTSTSTNSPTSYSWTFTGGTPSSSTIANPTVTYSTAGTYNVSLTATNASGSNTSTQAGYMTVITTPATPGTITGNATLCSGSTGNVYSISAVSGATSYTWTVPAGSSIASGQGTTSATVTFGSTSGNVTVTATNTCGTSTASIKAVTVNSIPAAPGTISGTSSVCSGSSGNVFSIGAVSGATSYTWTVPSGASITSGQGSTSATVTFGATSGNVSVTATNSCGTSSASTSAITVSSTPAAPGTISGSATACSGSSGNIYTISSVSGATSYTWTVPSGASISSGQGTTSATITFGATPGNVSVTASNSCGTSSSTILAVTLTSAAPATPGTIAGSINVCASSIENTYSISSVSGATNYTWTVPSGASVTSGQGTTSISINFGTSSGDVSVTASSTCGTSGASTLSITVNSAPTLNDPVDQTICAGDQTQDIVFSGSSASSTYSWTNDNSSIGLSSSGNGDITAFTTASSGTANLMVTPTLNGCEGASQTVSIIVNPLPTVTQSTYSLVCVDWAAFTLTNGSPSGGTYSGTGVSGNSFDPSAAGVGTYSIDYTYSQNGCTNSAISSITVDDCLGMTENDNSVIVIYPNPTDDKLIINGELKDKFDKLILFDATGRLVEKWEINSNNIELYLGKYSTGIYTLKISGVSGEFVRRIAIK